MRHALAPALLACLMQAPASPLAAEEGTPPLPPERPAVEGPPAPSVPGSTGVPVPPERPPETGGPAPLPEGEANEDAAPLPPERPVELGGAPAEAPKPPVVNEAGEEACRAHLRQVGADFADLPAIAEGACGAPRPVRLSSTGAGVTIAPAATLTCAMAEAIATWSRDVVGPAAEAAWHEPLTAIRIGTSYQCRGQNHDPHARLSEHAYANGADVAGFELRTGHGVTITTQKEGSPEEAFQKAVRQGACTHFTTVLGPGTNAEHADHLHIDLRARTNGYRICQ